MLESSARYLLEKFLRNQCSPGEKAALARWIRESAHDETLKKILDEAWKDFEASDHISGPNADNILSGILKKAQITDLPLKAPVRNILWKRLSTAAVIILLLGTGTYFLLSTNSTPVVTKKVQSTAPHLDNDAYPGRQKAVLTLADGAEVLLDSASTVMLPQQGNTTITIINGELVYDSRKDKVPAVIYNTLTTHRGQLYPLRLADDSRVWLNSASSIRFPVAFDGTERVVEVTGEAYFEVAKNTRQPFKVELNGMRIEVLGTHFNVNSYSDEALIKTTLLEGSVKISAGKDSLVLSPGQQAGMASSGKFKLIKEVDTEEAVSWKDGYFHFRNANLRTVMRQLSRWYNVDVVYETRAADQHFGGDINKNLLLSEVLTILEKSQVHAKIEGNKLIVL